MVKTLNVPFNDDEYEMLSKLKGEGKSWHDWILELARKETEGK